jgi:hypothetical protein
MPAMPRAVSDRALLRANELADTQKQLADETERALRGVGLSWHDFAQYDRVKPWVKKALAPATWWLAAPDRRRWFTFVVHGPTMSLTTRRA